MPPAYMPVLAALAVAGTSMAPQTAWAQGEADTAAMENVRQRLDELVAAQRALSEEIAEVKRTLVRLETVSNTDETGVVAVSRVKGGETDIAPDSEEKETLSVFGDFRVRHEQNFGSRTAASRARGAIRGRIGVRYAPREWLHLGARLVTGDPDDPNSSDVTLGEFANDLDVSLDQAYAELRFGGASIYGGKFPQIFTRTDLVWDGDVNLQGLGGAYAVPFGDAGALRLKAAYMPVSEDAAGPDSRMLAGQIGLSTKMSEDVEADLALGYYDYTLRSLNGARAGDFRSNLRDSSGAYLSDFNLLNGVVSLTYRGLAERWPIRFTGDFVHNFGAVADAGTGYSAGLSIGDAAERGDWRFGYGYAVTQTDAVFAAFSNDNIPLATNYRLHTVSADYSVTDFIVLNATFYRFRQNHGLNAGARDWVNRLRLNAEAKF